MRMVDLPYTLVAWRSLQDLQNSPKGKFPYIEDNGKKIADSSFILAYLRATYGDKLGENTLNPQQQAIAHEELGDVRIIVFARNDFFHRVANGFEAMELLNLSYNCGLIDMYDRATAEKHSRRRPKADAQPYHQDS